MTPADPPSDPASDPPSDPPSDPASDSPSDPASDPRSDPASDPRSGRPIDQPASLPPSLLANAPALAGLLRAIDHVGVAVPDLDAAVTFYREVLGMRLLHQETNQEQGVREAMMGVGESGSCVQLLAPLTPQSTIARFLDRNGPGLQQVAYRVDDVDAVCAVLRDLGIRLLYDTPRRGTANSRINFVHPKDAGGVLIELVEPPTPL